MPWRETCVMDQRLRFVSACLAGEESMSELCRQYGISRKNGGKWLRRYLSEGVVGLQDRSRAPHSNARSVDGEAISEVLSVRHRYPSWGPRKVKAWLEERHPDQAWPAASTIGELFDRAGLTRPRKRRRRVPPQSVPLAGCAAPNDVWCADFKGWFLTGDGTHVEPFTVSDGYSRFLIRCQAVARIDEGHVWPALEAAFREYGLPRALRSDNGPPFASRAAGGLSRFAVKLIKAGVLPERIEPGKPQQNGRHERLHLTLKQDTAAPPARSLAEQIDRFERFRETYNTQRPHEALGQRPPARVYLPSPRRFDGVLRSPDYPDEARIRRVRSTGEIKWHGDLVFLSEALIGEPVGLREIAEDVWLVNYGPIVLGTMKGRQGFMRMGSGRPSRPHALQNKPQNL
ncbi:integrase core domain-containing protein [Inquilinus sp. CAU 1745]|uniref:integrase core domain-containing protein n=1 Tax=Inquilinus sp. CAU 1745 TaxID=3140369 RepID=UPI00325BF10D